MYPDATVVTSFGSFSVPKWSLCGDGHVIAASIVHDTPSIEAHIVLDGQLLYRSRHASHDAAEQELVSLRGYWAGEGWIDAA